MPATYNALLATDKDWIRLLSGDRGPKFVLSDEEINALLAAEQNRWLAAARACEVIMTRNQGVVTKEVGDLKLQWSDTAENSYARYIRSLRERGAAETFQGQSVFRVLG